jgi:hypothetical protein
MNEESDTDPPEDAVWPPPIQTVRPPVGGGDSGGRGRALALIWAFGIVLNLAVGGHKDFPESLRHNLLLLAADAVCWLVAGLLWWCDVRARWRQEVSVGSSESLGQSLRRQWVPTLLLALCAAFGVFIGAYRAAYSDFW